MVPHTPAQTLKEGDAAAYTGTTVAYLRRRRLEGGGPPFLRLGRMVRYRIVDLDQWLEAHVVGGRKHKAS